MPSSIFPAPGTYGYSPFLLKRLDEMKNRGYELSNPGLYYHLSELKDAGVIEVSSYVEEGRGAPEKKWKLAREKIEIDLVGSGE
ncbi:hypothetical protein AKJ48_02210 [candidate division MSBL1 archaeon SCGC-AAA261O19]|uniref:Uncharacterized protein n=1 Tax=candidate division MSBL1 archaeon SCGC-AAA261O19 TaxID=1698277 RepID=A0A133VDP1_9EURY|nr:hypothetical protein AKJ48_02210 [candidate division MSBL1 archaeon SCGC-AAA261O19]